LQQKNPAATCIGISFFTPHLSLFTQFRAPRSQGLSHLPGQVVKSATVKFNVSEAPTPC